MITPILYGPYNMDHIILECPYDTRINFNWSEGLYLGIFTKNQK